MKKIALHLFTFCLTLALLLTSAVAETNTGVDYTVEEKLLKQLQAGSGFEGTLTVESTAVAGRESEAVTTIKPLTFDCTYLYIREDATSQTAAESRMGISLVDGSKTLGTVALSIRDGALYLNSTLLGDGWYAFDGLAEASETAGDGKTAADGALRQTVNSLIAQTAMPGLTAFAANLLTHLHGADLSKWSDSLEAYTTKIDLWIEGFRQNAILGKTSDGTATMEVNYQIPATAIKAQLKQMLMDALADTSLMEKMKSVLSAGDANTFLNPEMQDYYFYAIDQLALEDSLTISRTVSLKGDTLALDLSLPLHDSEGGLLTLNYHRQKGAGDVPDENTLELRGKNSHLKVDYQNYDTLTGATVYQGTILREPLGEQAGTVNGNTGTAIASKTFSASFTLTSQRAAGTDADGKTSLTENLTLNLAPEYSPEVSGDSATTPTEAQAARYAVFAPLDLSFNASFTSGQAKNASTAVDATLEISGEQMPEIVNLHFSGKTKSKWTPDALDAKQATQLGTLPAADLQALFTLAAVKGGLLLLPYASLPSGNGATPAASASPADAAVTPASAAAPADNAANGTPTLIPTATDTPTPAASVGPQETATPIATPAV